jgi:trigger factor
MQVSIETTTGLGRRMTVQIPAEKLDQQVQSRLQQLTRTVKLDGFRPGKVPLSVVRKRFGDQVRQEATGELIASSYEEALQQENLKPASRPSIEQTSNRPGHELEYVATFEIFPEIEPPEVSDISIERLSAEITDADVDTMLEKLRRQRATWNPVERAAQIGDRIEIDFEGSIDGQPFTGNTASQVPLELGSKAMIPGFEEQLTGVEAGDSRTIEVTFPEDYKSAEVAGKTASFDVKVRAVTAPELPEIDDDFARVFGVGEGGLEALRGEIRRNMERELNATVKSRVKQQVFDALIEKASIEVPTSLVDGEIDELVKKNASGADAGADRSRYEGEARRRVTLGLLIAEIIQRNQLQVDPQRVRQTIEDLAQSYEKPEEVVQWYYSNQDMLAGVQTLIMEETVVEWVSRQAKISEKSVGFSDIMQA